MLNQSGPTGDTTISWEFVKSLVMEERPRVAESPTEKDPDLFSVRTPYKWGGGFPARGDTPSTVIAGLVPL